MILEKPPKINKLEEGWTKLTDLLRGQVHYYTTEEIKEAVTKLEDNARVKILRLKPRFGNDDVCKGLNDLTVNFVYNGLMICELQIKLDNASDMGLSPLYYSNHFVYEVQRCCVYDHDTWKD